MSRLHLFDQPSMLRALASVIDARDFDTHDHSVSVAHIAEQIGIAYGLPSSELERLVNAALLHDIGKIGIPDAILRKPSALDDSEWAIMRQHPITGARIVSAVLPKLAPAIRHHHERWDGTGYPSGTAGEAIPLHARIIAVADAFDTMTSNRPYQAALPLAIVVSKLQAGSGTQWQPRLIDILVYLVNSPESHLGDGSIPLLDAAPMAS